MTDIKITSEADMNDNLVYRAAALNSLGHHIAGIIEYVDNESLDVLIEMLGAEGMGNMQRAVDAINRICMFNKN